MTSVNITQAPKAVGDTVVLHHAASGGDNVFSSGGFDSAPRTLAILIPVFNNEPGLLRTLASLERDPTAYDVIIVDDGSYPPLPKILSCGVHSVVVLRQDTNTGITDALNRSLEHALHGPYSFVARIDAGDLAIPGRMQKQLTYLRENPRCGAVASYADFIDENGRFLHRYRAPITHQTIMRQMHINNCILHATTMMRLEAIRRCGSYSNAFGTAGEDYELFLRMSRRFELAVIPEVLTRCEDNVGGISVVNRRSQQKARLRLQRAYFDPAMPQSYYGILRTLVAFCIPRDLVLLCKRWLKAS